MVMWLDYEASGFLRNQLRVTLFIIPFVRCTLRSFNFRGSYLYNLGWTL
jgi:hypothetical protein